MYTFEIWDKKSTVNGVEASYFLEEYGITDGAVYLIHNGDHVVVFQPYKPGISGRVEMTEDEAKQIAEEQVLQLTESYNELIID